MSTAVGSIHIPPRVLRPDIRVGDFWVGRIGVVRVVEVMATYVVLWSPRIPPTNRAATLRRRFRRNYRPALFHGACLVCKGGRWR